MTSKDADAFATAFRAFQRKAIWGSLGSLAAFFCLAFALLPLAPSLRQLFRVQVGGDLGEVLMGLSLPVMASPPVLLFFVWVWRRGHDPDLRCGECGMTFTSEKRFRLVAEKGACPRCDSTQFPTGAKS